MSLPEKTINQIAQTTEITADDVLIVETSNGTKTIKYSELMKAVKTSLGVVDTLDITEEGYIPEGYLVAAALEDKQAQIRASYGYFGKELPFTWAEIDEKETAGDFSGINVGDYKDIMLTNGEKVRMEVAGINTRKGYATNNNNCIHWISRDCLATTYKMNETNTNTGGFPASTLKTTLNTTIYNMLPADVKAVIKTNKRLCSKKGSWDWQEDQKLWLPSEVEVWGFNSWSEVGYGNGNAVQFEIFRGSLAHINKGLGFGKAEQGSRSNWWCESPDASSTTYFCNVSSDGHPDSYSASTPLGVPLCFGT